MHSSLKLIPGALLMVAFGVAQAASDMLVVPGQWIVELESPAAVAYRGDPVFQIASASGKPVQRLAATAPDVSGQARYDAHSAAARAYADHLDQERSVVLEQTRSLLGRSLEPSRTYRHIFNGFVAAMDKHEAERLADLPGVRSVQPVMAQRLHLDAGPALIGAPMVHVGSNGLPASGGGGVVIGVIDTGINWDNMYFSDDDLLSGHVFSNPMGRQLGLCSRSDVACNNKLIGVYDFTDEETQGKDPSGHGSHVAGIAAGVPIQFRLDGLSGDHLFRTTGVAPHANIVSYKVCYGTHPSDSDLDDTCDFGAIMEAWEQAVVDGVDVVNYSIGGSPVSPWGSAGPLLNLWSAGIPFVTSAGNEGPDAGTVGYPANAPWVFAVGSSTHGRLIGHRVSAAGLSNLLVNYGSGPEPTTSLTAPIVAADSVSDSMLACQAFPGSALAGAVALIERGDCTFELKVNNAANAGAVAVLIYNNLPGPPIAMGGLEASSIPAAMMDLSSGQQVRAAIDRSTNPTATLSAEGVATIKPAWRDLISDFSSRGPAQHAPGVLKPNVVAPGSNILSAYSGGENSIGFSSGTSMASPHVAGAAALIKAIHPSWGPDRIQSVLETTAEAGDLRWNNVPAGAFDRGAGRIRVDQALRAGLYLPVTRSQFEAADPRLGGNPANLNLAGMWAENCEPSCSFTRRVVALQDGNWLVSAESLLPVTVSPDQFSLSAGQQQLIEISVDTLDLVGPFAEGAVYLTPTSGDLVEQKLTVGISLPSIDLEVDSNRGRQSVSLVMDAMAEPVFYSSGLERPLRESFTLQQDPSRNSPYEGTSGRRTFFYDLDEDALLLWAEVVASEASDIDLFVGYDSNGNRRADEDEERCRSISPGELEQCIIENPEPGAWWVMVQNWQASETGASDDVELDVLSAYARSDASLVARGPGQHAGGLLPLMVQWDQPAMRRGERHLGAIALSSNPDQPADRGILPVQITRTGQNPVAATALFSGETLAVTVPPHTRHDLLYIDVPPEVGSLAIQVEGDSDISLALHRLDFDAIAGYVPGTAPAPESAALATGSGSAAGISLTYLADAGAELEPGRYYVVLDNSATTEGLVEVSASIQENTAHLPRFGLWGPADHVTNQGIEWNAGSDAGMIVWYSYDEDGLPVFYNAVEPIDPQRSTWAADLLRTTSIGERQNIDVVGRVGITALGDEELIMSWRLNGAHGSERMTPNVATSCAEVDGVQTSYSGLWYSPLSSQGGTTMIVTADSQAQVRYYFDRLGIGRWVITTDAAGAGPLAEQLDVLELRGFCPDCSPVDVSIETVGSYMRLFQSEDRATEILEFESLPPLNQSYSTEVSIHKLTSRRDCE